jgi:thiamine-phosphate pyrophosphorylase
LIKGAREKLLNARLYAIIGHEFEQRHGKFEDIVGKLANGGVSVIQLREKRMAKSKLLDEAKRVKRACEAHGVIFIVNDYPDVAIQVGADGVHIGSEDMPINSVKKIVGNSAIIGFSATNIEEALEGEKNGADYLGVGAIFPTSTKRDAKMVSELMLQKIMRAVTIPVFALGGINVGNLARLIELGVQRVAISSALLYSDDIEKTARFFYKRLSGS